MLRVLLTVVVPLILTIYTLVECIQTPEDEVRNLPKLIWLILILVGWIVGPIAWLIAGRPNPILPNGLGRGRRTSTPSGPRGPEDDPDFLRNL